MITLTEIQTRILESLAHYRFLTHSQMGQLRLGSPSFLRFSTRRLRERTPGPLIASIRYPFAPHEGRLEQVHHLTQAGAAVLSDIKSDDTIEQSFRPVTAIYHRDYWHRKFTIDFQIALTQAIEGTEHLDLAAFDRYFDKTGSNRGAVTDERLRSSTRVDLNDEEHLIPDANVLVHRSFDEGQQVLYTAEIANGKDTKRVLHQIGRHARLLRSGRLAVQYGLPKKTRHQVLFVFSDFGLLKAVRSRLPSVEPARPYAACFRFGFLDFLRRDVLRCWQQPEHLSDDWHHLITGKPVEVVDEPLKGHTSSTS